MSAEFLDEHASESSDVPVQEFLAYLNGESVAVNAAEAGLVTFLDQAPYLANSAPFSFRLGKIEGQKDTLRGVAAWLAARNISIEDLSTES